MKRVKLPRKVGGKRGCPHKRTARVKLPDSRREPGEFSRCVCLDCKATLYVLYDVEPTK